MVKKKFPKNYLTCCSDMSAKNEHAYTARSTGNAGNPAAPFTKAQVTSQPIVGQSLQQQHLVLRL